MGRRLTRRIWAAHKRECLVGHRRKRGGRHGRVSQITPRAGGRGQFTPAPGT
jgi:hypothetical protein